MSLQKVISLTVISLFVLGAGLASAQPAKPLDPAAIIALMNASSVTYTIKSEDDRTLLENAAATLYPQLKDPIAMPKLVQGPNGPYIDEIETSNKAEPLIQEAEAAYYKKEFASARAKYVEAYRIEPLYYPALEFIGDTYFGEHQYDTAIIWYDKAKQANPLDYQPYLYRADALDRLGRADEARQAMIEVLTLRPRYKNALLMAHGMSQRLKMEVHDSNFAPHAYAVKAGGDSSSASEVDVVTSATPSAPWVAYANAKAIWLGEPKHRSALSGNESDGWTMDHERECIANLLAGYAAARANGAPADAELDRIQKIVDDGMLDAFIVYEITSRLYPNITLTLPAKSQAYIRSYVEKYVLPKVG